MIFLNSLETEIELINNSIKSQKNLKLIILKYMQNYIEKSETNNFGYANSALKLLEEVQKYINMCNENISSLDKALTKLKDFKLEENNPDFILDNELNKYSEFYSNVSKKVSENTLIVEEYIHYIAENSKFMPSTQSEPIVEEPNLPSTPETIVQNTISPTSDYLEKKSSIITPESLTAEKNNNTATESLTENSIISANESSTKNSIFAANDSLTENTLIISEKSGNVILPYKIENLNKIKESQPNKYSSLNDVIQSKYTIPISNYKNLSLSRFREAFKLMRKKEHGSFLDAFDLGMELAFNYKIHPAIISACNSLDELDIYLDYLDSGNTDKFSYFKVIFELTPMISKKSKKAF